MSDFFKLKENKTSVRTEIRAGLVTFLTMSYIIFVQPAILSSAGMDFNAVMSATCISAAIATLLMGIYANYPIAQAPLMGENVFFVTVVATMGISWKVALGAVFISGLFFLLLTFMKVRELLINIVPDSLKSAIAAGIGLFIAFIGFQQGSLILADKDTLVRLGDITSPAAILCLLGLLSTIIFMVMKIRGAILWGMLLTTFAGLISGKIQFSGFVSLPPSLEPTFLKLDLAGSMNPTVLIVALVFLFMLMFDTVGTLIGVCTQAGFIKNGQLPRANKALVSDAVGTLAGSLLGTSTVSSYIESAAGVAAGGRTGLVNMVTGLLFISALFFSPLVKMVGGGILMAGKFYYPVTAPIMIIVGSLMMKSAVNINWEDLTEAIPAFLTIVGMPFTYNIVNGLAFGFITYPILKLAGGRMKEISWLVYLLGILFLLRYIFLKI